MARVTGKTRTVKNLGWFFTKVRVEPVKSIVLTHVEHSYVMEVVFDDGWIFVTPFASVENAKRRLWVLEQVQGQKVAVVDGDALHEFEIKNPIYRTVGDY